MYIASNTSLAEIVQYGTPEQLFEHRLTILNAVEQWEKVEEIMEESHIMTVAGIETYIRTHTRDDVEYDELEKRVEALEDRNAELDSDNTYLKDQLEGYRERLAEVESE